MSKVAATANAMGVDVDQLNAQIATIIAQMHTLGSCLVDAADKISVDRLAHERDHRRCGVDARYAPACL